MQIGNAQMDAIYREVIAPVLLAAGINPRRVDRHNEGRLLNSEIARMIRESEIIVADLTNERPNCYLEVGYAMGLERFANLILSARADHKPDRVDRKVGDPKVHFDLSGYDFLYWSPEDLSRFRDDLQQRVRRRLSNLPGPVGPQEPWSGDWLAAERKAADEGARGSNLAGYMEVVFCVGRGVEYSQKLLLETAKKVQIHTFGWPLWMTPPAASGGLVRLGMESQRRRKARITLTTGR